MEKQTEEILEQVAAEEAAEAQAEQMDEVEIVNEHDPTDRELELMRKNKEQEEAIRELTDRVQRTMAEFDNFRKRTAKEKAAMVDLGARDVLEKLLPVVDNFERALDAIPEEERGGALAQGVDMIYKQMVCVLEDVGVAEIDAMHQEFDPNLHNAVQHEHNEEYDENTVAAVYLKGYTYKDTVIRHSMVKVVN
ncbi:nucleotide exchange factor GrpE [Anaerotalea alkaliphila]|uniref:Protein GrpE n=1 Tax=Anaerotalea alkaliphila TaxID=2662126 RepID=A0A7X5HX32_9FIRM|nr:nucleotide exchange factor GrpE [Anaerotalea alkaliphila]